MNIRKSLCAAIFISLCSLLACETEEMSIRPSQELKINSLTKSDIVAKKEYTIPTSSLSLQQGYNQGRQEAESVFNTYFYKGQCLTGTIDQGGPGHSLIECWKAYDENNGYMAFASFCYQYQTNMINTACSTNSCELRNYTLEILRGFNEYMMLNPELFNHGYVGDLSGTWCTSPCQ